MIRLKTTTNFQSIEIRQCSIEQDQIRSVVVRDRKRLNSAAGLQDLVGGTRKFTFRMILLVATSSTTSILPGIAPHSRHEPPTALVVHSFC